MKITINKKHRYLSLILAVTILLSTFGLLNSVVSADEEILYEGDTLNGWQVDSVWENGSKELDVLSSRNEELVLKQTVTYYAPLTSMTKAYPPGTVKFKIPDFGVLKRSGKSFPITTATDQVDTDWSCEYNVTEQMYVFTNVKTFEANKPLSGGFELFWTARSRESMTDFSMTESPIFMLENEGTRMTPMTLNCVTVRDFYIIDLQRDFLTYAQYDDPSINKNAYVSYNYRTYFYLQERARAAYLNDYFVKVSFKSDDVSDEQMSKILVQYWTEDGKTETYLTRLTDPGTGESVWGFYRFKDRESYSLGYSDFVLSYPKTLNGKTATVDTELLVLYYDENEYVTYQSSVEGEILVDHDDVKINEYQFWYGDGNFSMIKRSPYERDSYTNGGAAPYKYSDRLLSKKIFNNERVNFTLGARYRFSTGTGASAS